MSENKRERMRERMYEKEREKEKKQTKRKLQINQPLLNYTEIPQDPI